MKDNNQLGDLSYNLVWVKCGYMYEIIRLKTGIRVWYALDWEVNENKIPKKMNLIELFL